MVDLFPRGLAPFELLGGTRSGHSFPLTGEYPATRVPGWYMGAGNATLSRFAEAMRALAHEGRSPVSSMRKALMVKVVYVSQRLLPPAVLQAEVSR